MSDTIVKILGWETKGLRIPDWKIDTIINDENIALILMPSGMGKTTTLALLRYSFFDYSKIVTRSDIEVLQSKNKKIKEGEFNLKLKINNNKIRIQTIFNFENYTMSYKTTTQATEGTISGLKLPSELNKYIDQEYIEKTFFNLELVEDLLKSSHAERSVKKLYKLDYLTDIKNLLFNYLKEQQSKSKAKVSNEKVNQLTLKISKIEKQIDLINQENNKNQLSYEKLLDEKRKLEKENSKRVH
jgi:DNA sulfur modification protein DndD